MRYYRQLRGLTTSKLAEKLNIVPATVLGYEQGRFPIPYDIAVLLAEELQISESLLFDDFCVFILEQVAPLTASTAVVCSCTI